MKKISKNTAGFEKVVYDQVDSTFVGGIHVDATNAGGVFTDGVIPAGTAITKDPEGDGTGRIMDWTNTDGDEGSLDTSKIIGLVHKDTPIDDYPLVAVVQAGTARIAALPEGAEREQTFIDDLKAALPRISFY